MAKCMVYMMIRTKEKLSCLLLVLSGVLEIFTALSTEVGNYKVFLNHLISMCLSVIHLCPNGPLANQECSGWRKLRTEGFIGHFVFVFWRWNNMMGKQYDLESFEVAIDFQSNSGFHKGFIFKQMLNFNRNFNRNSHILSLFLSPVGRTQRFL